MGKSSVDAGKLKPLAGHLGHLTWDSFPDFIAQTYGTPGEPEVMFLIEQLIGLSMRDQRAEGPQSADAERQRLAVHAAAKAIVSHGQAVEIGLKGLQVAISDFDAAVRQQGVWSAVMLEEAFDIPYVAANAIEPPVLFDPVRGFFIERAEVWEKIESDLQSLSALPVRRKLRPNRVRDHALEQGLVACREYWVKQIGRSWSRSSLTLLGPSDCDVRPAPVHLLKGDCERFVVDMLTAADIRFNLKSLNGAWSALDKRRRPLRSKTPQANVSK